MLQNELPPDMTWFARRRKQPLGPFFHEPPVYVIVSPQSPERTCAVRDRTTAFEVGDTTMKLMDRVYEAAGLYAWRETLRDLENWEHEQLARVRRPLFEGERCILHARGGFDHGSGYREPWDQLAVFDPEAGQWHFVPRDVVTGEVS